jgi:hypothetical protein
MNICVCLLNWKKIMQQIWRFLAAFTFANHRRATRSEIGWKGKPFFYSWGRHRPCIVIKRIDSITQTSIIIKIIIIIISYFCTFCIYSRELTVCVNKIEMILEEKKPAVPGENVSRSCSVVNDEWFFFANVRTPNNSVEVSFVSRVKKIKWKKWEMKSSLRLEHTGKNENVQHAFYSAVVEWTTGFFGYITYTVISRF